jgi:hypothetical protein
MLDGMKMSPTKIDYKTMIHVTIVYLLVFLISTLGVELLKSIVTGTAGPTTRFLTRCVIAPCALVGLGFWFGRVLGLVTHALVLMLLGLFIYLNWPIIPLMDFKRQLVSEMEVPLLFAFAFCSLPNFLIEIHLIS